MLYKLPRLGTAEKWRAAGPPGFEFTVKAWQWITHEPSSPTYRRLGREIEPAKFERYGFFRPTPEVQEAWEQTAAFARARGARRVVFQCPAYPLPRTILRSTAWFLKTIPGAGTAPLPLSDAARQILPLQ